MKRLRQLGHTLGVAAGIAAAAVVLQILLATRLSFIEMKVLDVVLRATCPRQQPSGVEVVDVGSDSSRYEGLRCRGDSPLDGCNVPRIAYARATERLSRWGAKATIFDLMFARRCRYEDAELARAFAAAGNVIVCATSATRPGAVALTPPVSPLAESAWGICAPVVDRPNGTVRSVPLAVQAENTGAEYLALSLLGFLRLQGLRPDDVRRGEGDALDVGGTRVPTVSGEQVSLLPLRAPDEAPVSATPDAAALQVVSGSATAVSTVSSRSVMLIRWAGARG